MCLDRDEECCCSDAESEVRQEALSEIEELHGKLQQHLAESKELMEEVFDKLYQVDPDSGNRYWPNIDTLSNLEGWVDNSMTDIRRQLQQAV